ncbi:MAG TPA: hypothetical protein VFN11_17760 [Ktedonobacterales bacterium]|nr:hypothetical protein [Ktedonobacterales bacterium]
MEPTYQFWQFVTSGDIFAVRLEHDDVSGICGPLHRTEVRRENLPDFDYDDQRDDVAWAQEHEPEGWRMFEPPTPEALSNQAPRPAAQASTVTPIT